MIEDVHIVQMHSLQALVNAGHQIFSASEIPVGSRPHIISGLGRDDQLIPVRTPVHIHVTAEIPLRFTVGRSVIVGQVKMRDALIKRGAENLLLCGKRCDVSKVVPQSQRKGRQLQTAVPAASVFHLIISAL